LGFFLSVVPVNYIDPTGHFTCQIGSLGEEKGITTTDCENWVNDALAALGLTETGSQIVDWFWAADAAAGEGGLSIVVGGTFFAPNLQQINDAYWGTESIKIGINDALNSVANFIGKTLYLRPDMVLSDPFDPNNWGVGGIATFAHETIHAYQGFEEAFTLYGEAQAFLYEGMLVDEMNALITQYNAGMLSGDEGYTKPIDQHSEVIRLRRIIDTGPAPWYNIDNLLAFRHHPRNAYRFHRVYSWNARISEDMLR